jgi:hypothetical protein
MRTEGVAPQRLSLNAERLQSQQERTVGGVQQNAKTYVQEQCITCHGFYEGVDRVITLLQRVVNGDDKWLHREMGLSEMGDPLAKKKKGW